MKVDNILQTIGKTPHVRINRLFGPDANVWVKSERSNPGGSIKDRIALAMVEDAEKSGALQPGGTIIEPTSGNTGIALAMIAAARGYRLILTMPEAMSQERVTLLRAYGAEVVLTQGTLMKNAVDQAELLGRTTPGSVLLRQFENPANPRAHEETTAEEIWRDAGGDLDVFVAGVGTGGTITGVARRLKPRRAGLCCVAVEPASAAVLSGGPVAAHHLQGIGAGFVPTVLDRTLIDRVVAVTEDEALDAARRLARSDGVLAGISSGAALAAVFRIAPEFQHKRIVVVLCDTGERYVSTALFRSLAS